MIKKPFTYGCRIKSQIFKRVGDFLLYKTENRVIRPEYLLQRINQINYFLLRKNIDLVFSYCCM